MKQYTYPEMSILSLLQEDILTLSGGTASNSPNAVWNYEGENEFIEIEK